VRRFGQWEYDYKVHDLIATNTVVDINLEAPIRYQHDVAAANEFSGVYIHPIDWFERLGWLLVT
jgi:hypothetical protein